MDHVSQASAVGAGTPGSAAPPPASSPDPSLYQFFAPLLRRWRLVVAVPMLFVGVAIGVALVLPPAFTAATSFTTDPGESPGSGSLGGLAGLAGQFGITGLPSTGPSPDFYAEVLKSHELLRATLDSRFPVGTGNQPDSTLSLLDLLQIRGATSDNRVHEGLRYLGHRISTRVDRRAGIVTLGVEAPRADLAAAVANRMVELLNDFNLKRRQSQSRAQREFVGERLTDAEQQLQQAEAAHLAFLQANRRYEDAPLLRFEEGRLARIVAMRQEILVTLRREYEQARIAEVRDTPVLTILDPAMPPDRRSFPRRKLIVIVAAFLGTVLSVGTAHLVEARRAAEATGRSDYRALKTAWEQFRADLHWPVRAR